MSAPTPSASKAASPTAPAPAAPPAPPRWHERRVVRTALAALGVGVAVVVVHALVMPDPYHIDTAAYVDSVRRLVDEGVWANGYHTRPMVSLALVPLGLVAGVDTLSWTLALAVVSALVCSLVWLGRAGSRLAGGAQLLVWLTPAGVVVVTHNKEDPIAIAFLVGALAAAGARSLAWVALGGLLCGMAILSKELVVLAAPIVLATAALCEGPSVRTRALRVGIVAGVAALFVLAVSPGHFDAVLGLTGSAATGRFEGPFSKLLPKGIELWRDGVGAPLFYGAFVGLAWPFLETTRRARLFAVAVLLQGVGLGLFLANTTVMTPRHFMWPALFLVPAAVRTLELVARRAAARWVPPSRAWLAPVVVGALGLGLALPGLVEAVPATAFRLEHNLVAQFYRGIPPTPRDALFVGMDNCMHVSFYARRECRRRGADLDAAKARAFAEDLAAVVSAGREVYLIPDATAYDRGNHVARALDARFTAETVYRAWYEDYHAMSLGAPLDEVADELSKGGRCGVEVGPELLDDGLAARPFKVSCPDAAPKVRNVVVAGDVALVRVQKGRLLRLRLK